MVLPGPVFSSVRGARVRTGPTGSRQAAAATGARPPWATVTQPRGDAPRRGYGAPPPVDSRRLVPDRPWRRGIPAADHCAPGLDTVNVVRPRCAAGAPRWTAPSPPALCSAIGEMPRCAGMPRLSWGPHRGGIPRPGWEHPQLPVRGEPDEPTLLGDHNPRCGRPERAPRLGPHGRFTSGGSDVLVLPGGVLVVLGAGLEAAVQNADEPVRELPQRGVVADLPGPERVVIGPRAG